MIKKLSTLYELSDDTGIIINCIVHGESLTIQGKNNQPFKFHNSKPELVEKIAKLLLEAVNLVENGIMCNHCADKKPNLYWNDSGHTALRDQPDGEQGSSLHFKLPKENKDAF